MDISEKLVKVKIRKECKEEFISLHVEGVKHPRFPPDIENLTWVLPMWLFMLEFSKYNDEYPIEDEFNIFTKNIKTVNLNENVELHLISGDIKCMKIKKIIHDFGEMFSGDVRMSPTIKMIK